MTPKDKLLKLKARRKVLVAQKARLTGRLIEVNHEMELLNIEAAELAQQVGMMSSTGNENQDALNILNSIASLEVGQSVTFCWDYYQAIHPVIHKVHKGSPELGYIKYTIRNFETVRIRGEVVQRKYIATRI